MPECLIVTSRVEGKNLIPVNPEIYDDIYCADAGLYVAESMGIRATRLIGDYDSGEMPSREVLEKSGAVLLPMEKDMTDSEAAIDLAYADGYRDITVLGGLGGRFDHTMGNIGLLSKYLEKGISLCFEDGYNRVSMKAPGTYYIHKDRFKYLGLVSYSATVENLSVSGTKYSLENHTLTNKTTLGVSNEITSDEAVISFTEGELLIIESNDVK